jgi:hypothetical protein
MTHEEDLLEKIKFVLLCKNEAQAIRLLEQYGFDKIEEFKLKNNIKNNE